MNDEPTAWPKQNNGTDAIITKLMTVIEYAIVVSLVLVASVVLVRTLIDFFAHWGMFSQTVVAAIDGILVVIILLDIAHTVFGNLRTLTFPVRPFLVIGILAGVRDILSASAHLTLNDSLTQRGFTHTLVSLGVGVGVVVLLLVGLLILRFAHHYEGHERS
ncbi:MAG TPA: phosphate-starvation-inducible PsiE family protein [Acidimicrobiales bacterium]|nr:phosphate-starvation-inducible PsiE family protein [Acidimicrobiales bacterium]